MVWKVRTVKVARAAQNSEVGQPLQRIPRVYAFGCPQVEPGFTVINSKTGRLERGLQNRTAISINLFLSGNV